MVELIAVFGAQALVSAGEPAVPVDDRHKSISRGSAFDAQRCLPAALVGGALADAVRRRRPSQGTFAE